MMKKGEELVIEVGLGALARAGRPRPALQLRDVFRATARVSRRKTPERCGVNSVAIPGEEPPQNRARKQAGFLVRNRPSPVLDYDSGSVRTY